MQRVVPREMDVHSENVPTVVVAVVVGVLQDSQLRIHTTLDRPVHAEESPLLLVSVLQISRQP